MELVHYNNSSLLSFNRPNSKKELCVDNKVKETVRDMYYPTCRIEKCVYNSTKKRLVSTTVIRAKPAVTFRKFLLRTKNRQLCCLVVVVYITVQERRVEPTEKEPFSIFEEINPPITIKHIRVSAKKKGRNHSIYAKTVSTLHWLMHLTKIFLLLISHTFNLHNFLKLKLRFWVVPRLWTRLLTLTV